MSEELTKQETKEIQVTPPENPTELVGTKKEELTSLQEMAKFMDDGGVFMWIILGIWICAIAIAFERIKALIQYNCDGTSLMEGIKKNILLNKVQVAIQDCSNTKALLPRVLRDGLKRANQSKEQIKDSLEASMLESIPLTEKRLHYLALIANISTLVGLLGTIYGLIQSFAAVASADPASKAELLALGISKAMNTTAFGLISAISIMVVHSILTDRSEKIIAEMEQCSVRLLDILGAKRGVQFTTEQPEEKAA